MNIIAEEAITFDHKVDCRVQYTNETEEVELIGRIKARGGYSRKFEKQSFALELERRYDLANLPADDDWVLNASYIDKTFLRHKLNYDLYRKMDSTNIAPRSAYVNVALDGKPNGLYVLMERINAAMLKLDKSDHKAVLWKEPPLFFENQQKKVQDPNNFYQQKFPKVKNANLTSYLDSLHTFLNESSDEEFLKVVENVFDLNSIIDWHLLLLLSNNSDGILKNFYLYRRNENEKLKIAPWDYDHSFGRDGDNELNMMERPLDVRRNILLKRLLDIPGSTYPSQLSKRYKQLRAQKVFSEKYLVDMIDSYIKTIKPEVRGNFKQWPVDSHHFFDDNNFDKEVTIIKTFVPLRLTQLDEYFDKF